jgi:formyltetrahydrofolate deformylase
MKNTAVLLLSTPMPLARKGVVAEISRFLIGHNGSVLHSDDHLDSGRDLFLSRLEWDLDGFDIPISDFEHYFKPVAERFQIHYNLALTNYRPKIAILVSAYDHCLADLLYRHSKRRPGVRHRHDYQQSPDRQAAGRLSSRPLPFANQSPRQARV